MKQIENNGLYEGLNSEELLTINGGSSIGEAIAEAAGWALGVYGKTLKKYGDHAIWTV